ncbi:conserved hypothetical protein [Curtobacterium sp. 8I-2]|nr:conserved hypothetical protein [Curtobacterium sp. 8I-2]
MPSRSSRTSPNRRCPRAWRWSRLSSIVVSKSMSTKGSPLLSRVRPIRVNGTSRSVRTATRGSSIRTSIRMTPSTSPPDTRSSRSSPAGSTGQSTRWYPRSDARSAALMKNCEVVGLKRLPVVGNSSAMIRVRRLASARATTLPRNFSSRIAVRTRAVVPGVTYFVPFTTKDTVAIETPARSATCCIVAMPLILALAVSEKRFTGEALIC